MQIPLLIQIGLDTRLGYKVKDDESNDAVFFRYSVEQQGWVDEQDPSRVVRSEHEAMTLLSLSAVELETEVLPWHCICARCCKKPGPAAALSELFDRHGETASSGFAPECTAEELQRVERLMSFVLRTGSSLLL